MTTLSTMTSPAARTISTSRADTAYLFKLGVDPHDGICDLNGRTFDLTMYGRLKYGCGLSIDCFGELLSKFLVAHFGDNVGSAFMAASPYKQVPTTACYLLDSTIACLTLAGLPPLGTVKLERQQVAAVDYARLTLEQRQGSTGSRGVIVPEATANTLRKHGARLIVVDDIRISGSTQIATANALNLAGITDVTFVHLAALDSAIGESNSAIEDQLNSTAVQSLGSLANLVNADSFRLNARTCKRILRAPAMEIRQFVRNIPPRRLQAILTAIVQDGYHLMPEHRLAFDTLVTAARVILQHS